MKKFILWFGVAVVVLVSFGFITLVEGAILLLSFVILVGLVTIQRDRSIQRDFREANEYIKKIKKLPSRNYDKKAFLKCKKMISQIVNQANTNGAFNRESEDLLKILLKDLKTISVISNVKLQ